MLVSKWFLSSNSAQFHGFASVKQRIGAYGSREFCAYAKRISGVSRDFCLCACYSTLLGILHLHPACAEIRRLPVSENWWLQAQISAVSRAIKLGPGNWQKRGLKYPTRHPVMKWLWFARLCFSVLTEKDVNFLFWGFFRFCEAGEFLLYYFKTLKVICDWFFI